MKSYIEFIDTHKNKNVFICGAGTSFFEVIENDNFKELNNQIVISVNSSIMAFNWHELSEHKREDKYWLSNDSANRNFSYWHNIKETKINRIVRTSWSKYYYEIPDFYVFDARKNNLDISIEEKRLVGVSSVPSAIDFSIQTGASNIYLLGVDHYHNNGKTHFWEYWERKKHPKITGPRASPSSQNNIFKENLPVYEKLNEFAKKCKCNIFNCNPQSKIDTFKKISLDDMYKSI
jgi:hypothetical protein